MLVCSNCNDTLMYGNRDASAISLMRESVAIAMAGFSAARAIIEPWILWREAGGERYTLIAKGKLSAPPVGFRDVDANRGASTKSTARSASVQLWMS